MGQALAEFAGWADPDGRKVLVVIVDNAGWHVAGKLVVPPNVVLYHLPPCTPDLQSAEPLWPLVREELANKTFPTRPDGASGPPVPVAGRGHVQGGRRIPVVCRHLMITDQRNSV